MSVIQASGVKLANKTLFSGIQPTGVFHIGNLLGALEQWVDLSRSAPNDAQIRFMVADLHAITVAKKPEELKAMRWSAFASILAAGVNPDRCSVYFQSDVPAHTELYWLLSSITSMGYLNRMVQWKSKANVSPDSNINQLMATGATDLNLGIFAYPTLQAADILLHQADYVPVGEDQAQHLELTRHVAQSFNHRFGNTFKIPSTVITPYKKILSLRDPNKKMSKSDQDQSACILMTDDADTVNTKLRRAVTDSVPGPILQFDPDTRPAVSNLVLIAAGFTGLDPQELLSQFRPQNHRQLKDMVAEAVIAKTGPMRDDYNRLMAEKGYLEQLARKGANNVLAQTANTIMSAKRNMGF